MSDAQTRLGEAVAARRRALGLSYAQVQHRGGPSDTRMSAIENGAGPLPRRSTLAKIDLTMRWVAGSAQRVLDGGEPEPLADQAPLDLEGDAIRVPSSEVVEIIASLRRLDRQFQSANNAVLADPNLHGAYLNHTGVASTIVGRWATALLERNVEQGQPLPPLLELALGPYLDAEMTHDRADVEEQLYRRWLAGRDANVSADQRAKFLRRLASRTEST